jgi:ribokinase
MRVPRVPVTGETVLGGEFSLGPGGKGSNQAIAARRLGAEVDLLSCIGPDSFGLDAKQLWAREHVGADSVKIGFRPTMVGFILVEPDGENRIAVAAGALDELEPADVDAFAETILDADICLVSLEIPLAVACAALTHARRLGRITILNPAPAVRLPDYAWGLVDYLTPNLVEAQILAGVAETNPVSLARALRRQYNGVIVLTLGSDGALVDDGERQSHVASTPVKHVVDTTGAGDAFNGALAVALAEGQSVLEAVELASEAAAYCVGLSEVIPALPRRTDLHKWNPKPRISSAFQHGAADVSRRT